MDVDEGVLRIGTINASDPNGGMLTYTLVYETDASIFDLNTTTGISNDFVNKEIRTKCRANA